NLAGLGLILFAIVLFIAEVKAATHGVLAAGGAVALIAGSLLLFSGHGDAGYRVDVGIILPGVAMTLGVVGFLTWKTIQIRRSPVRTGAASLVGKSARVVRAFDEPGGGGTVMVDGEY